MMRAVKKHAKEKWVELYVERWLKARALVNKVVFEGRLIEPPQSEIETWH
jgi:hypothetical protein